MTFQANNTLISTSEMLTELMMAPLRALGRGLMYMTETSSHAHTLDAIHAQSDAVLAAKGLTRDEAVLRAFSHYL